MSKLYGAIEAGGTKFICVVANSPENIIAQTQITTTTPSKTLDKVMSFFKTQPRLNALCIASFGPIDLDTTSSTYGRITTTPKQDWQNTDITGIIAEHLGCRVIIDTDVNCAALGEQRYGAAQGLDAVAYMTIGTGIGIGSVANNLIASGLAHTEMGHMLIPRIEGDTKLSACPFHNNCLEGLASGTALKARWGVVAESLVDETAWEQEAHYIACGLVNTIVCTMPKRIIVGGGVMNHIGLIEIVQNDVLKLLNGYIDMPAIVNEVKSYIANPGLGILSGVTGALILASQSP